MKWKDNGKPTTVGLDYNGKATSIPSFLTSHNQLLDRIPAPKNDTRLRIFSGTANPSLSQEIACYMGLELGKIKIKRFADGGFYVQLQESVRGCDVYLVQPTCPPANGNLMELLLLIDACRRASAKNITVVIPYFGYARADRKTQGRESIAAKLVANLIAEAGADRVLACDLHSGQSIGYFDIPVDHVHGLVMNLIGEVKGKVAVMVDDMIDIAGTIAKGAALLHQEGARESFRSREIVELTVSRGYHNKHYSSIRTELFSAAYNLICRKPLRRDYMACA